MQADLRGRRVQARSTEQGFAAMPEMQQRAAPLLSHAQANSNTTAGDENDDIDPHVPSSIPPWVHINENDEKAPFLEPRPVVPNTRHYKPPAKYAPGRKVDAFRDAEPPLLSAPIADHQVRWIPFMHSGPNPQEHQGEARVMSEQWMEQNMAIYGRGWEEEDDLHPERMNKPRGFSGLMYRGKWLISPERQERTVRLFWRLLLKNAFVPLIFRVVVLAFSCAALGISATIYESVQTVNADPNPNNQCAPRASTYMGIIVSTIAIPYIGYVTWDEYTSKP